MNSANPKIDLRKKREACLQAMRFGGGALELSGLVRMMWRLELVQWLEVVTAKHEHP